ncbi:MAG: methyltransferase domain-containing protein [Chloroflexi bacterium]|nr:methyltransferase domain-containing protein [Chloroflexota bacterium]
MVTPGAPAADHAQRFAQYVAPTLVTLARRVVDLAEIEPGQSVLDVATATGIAAFFAAERAGWEGTVVGLDPSEAMLGVARERSASVGYDYIRWQQGEAALLHFADESFDLVLCVLGLSWVANPFAAIEEMRRVLVERGRLVVTIWGTKTGNEWIGLLEEALRTGAPHAKLPAAPQLTQPGNLEALLQAAGFRDLEVAHIPDVMRFQGIDAFWEWARAMRHWHDALAVLPADLLERTYRALVAKLAPRVRDGELAIGRQIVYARAAAPEAP